MKNSKPMAVCRKKGHALKKLHFYSVSENRSYSHSFLDLFTEGKWKNLSKSSRVFVSGTG